MGIHFVRNVHFHERLQRIRPDQWATGCRKTLWWLGWFTQMGCIYLALVCGDRLGHAGQASWTTFAAALIAGIASWCLCFIVRIIGLWFPIPADIRRNNPPDKASQILGAIATVITLPISCLLLLISFITVS